MIKSMNRIQQENLFYGNSTLANLEVVKDNRVGKFSYTIVKDLESGAHYRCSFTARLYGGKYSQIKLTSVIQVSYSRSLVLAA